MGLLSVMPVLRASLLDPRAGDEGAYGTPMHIELRSQ